MALERRCRLFVSLLFICLFVLLSILWLIIFVLFVGLSFTFSALSAVEEDPKMLGNLRARRPGAVSSVAARAVWRRLGAASRVRCEVEWQRIRERCRACPLLAEDSEHGAIAEVKRPGKFKLGQSLALDKLRVQQRVKASNLRPLRRQARAGVSC